MLSNAAVNLSEQEADIAVRMHAPTQDTLVQRKVGEVALAFFAHRDYLARRGVPSQLAELAEHNLIGPDRAPLDLTRVQAMLPPSALTRMVVRTDSHPAQLAAVRAGLGIAVIHRPVGLADPLLLHVLPEHVFLKLPIYIVTHRDLRGVPRIKATFDHLADEFARYTRS